MQGLVHKGMIDEAFRSQCLESLVSATSSTKMGRGQVTEIPVSRELHIQRANPCSAINFRVADNPPETPQGYLVNLNA
jgi:hypothetical protein